jgi:apolipoprotein N-acyltransferase
MLLSRRAIEGGARFVIWPETATGAYLKQNLDQRLRLQGFVDSTETAVLAGYPDYRFTGPNAYLSWNAAGVFWPNTGLGPQYAKMHLVPFGERMPFQSLVPALGKVEFGQAEWTPGTDPAPLPTPLGPAGILVCFESIFPDPSRAEVLRGATWLVNITNDEWFGRSGALSQHAAMSVFRAVEHHVPLARCANTGLTFLVDPWGRITHAGPIFEDAVVVAPLPAHTHGATPFTRAGDTVGPALALAAALLLAASARAGLLARRALTAARGPGMLDSSTRAHVRRRTR